MLLNIGLEKYVSNLDGMIHRLEDAYVELYEIEVLTKDRLNIRLRIRVGDGFLLELNEAVVEKDRFIHHLGYRYHFQDGQNNLVFRYDNTPHFPQLKSHPDHKHLKDEVIEAEKPDIEALIREVLDFLRV
jgi:hypothetical protein